MDEVILILGIMSEAVTLSRDNFIESFVILDINYTLYIQAYTDVQTKRISYVINKFVT